MGYIYITTSFQDSISWTPSLTSLSVRFDMVIYHNEAMATTPMTGDGLCMFIPPIKVVILEMVYDSVYHVRVLRMVILGMGFIIDKMVMLTSPFFDLETFLIPSPVQKKTQLVPKMCFIRYIHHALGQYEPGKWLVLAINMSELPSLFKSFSCQNMLEPPLKHH